jgi:hypothetical protein
LGVHRLVAPTTNSDWDVAVRRGCLAAGRLHLATTAQPADCSPVYYLSGPNADEALMGATRAASQADVARQLADLLETRAKQENIRGLTNANGPLEGKVRLALAHVTIQSATPPRFTPGEEFPAATSTTLALGDTYMIKAYNDSDQDLWIALALLGADGSTQLIGPDSRGQRLRAGGSVWLTRVPFEAKVPTGRKTYKAIATTRDNLNFRVIEQPAGGRASVNSALEWLLTTRQDTAARSDNAGQGLSLDDWTTTRLDLDVRPNSAPR